MVLMVTDCESKSTISKKGISKKWGCVELVIGGTDSSITVAALDELVAAGVMAGVDVADIVGATAMIFSIVASRMVDGVVVISSTPGSGQPYFRHCCSIASILLFNS